MKKLFLFLPLAALLTTAGCRKDLLRQPVEPCSNEHVANPGHPMKDSVEAIMTRYIAKGYPGSK